MAQKIQKKERLVIPMAKCSVIPIEMQTLAHVVVIKNEVRKKKHFIFPAVKVLYKGKYSDKEKVEGVCCRECHMDPIVVSNVFVRKS